MSLPYCTLCSAFPIAMVQALNYDNYYCPNCGTIEYQNCQSQVQPMPIVEVSYIKEIDAYTIHFQSPGRQGWDLVKGMVEVIKATIPASDRQYDPGTKTWTITAERYNGIGNTEGFAFILAHQFTIKISLAKAPEAPIKQQDFFYSYSEPTSTSKESRESLTEKLQKILNCSLNDMGDSIKLKRLYRAKALELHPDRNNGDGARMSELNSLWSVYNG